MNVIVSVKCDQTNCHHLLLLGKSFNLEIHLELHALIWIRLRLQPKSYIQKLVGKEAKEKTQRRLRHSLCGTFLLFIFIVLRTVLLLQYKSSLWFLHICTDKRCEFIIVCHRNDRNEFEVRIILPTQLTAYRILYRTQSNSAICGKNRQVHTPLNKKTSTEKAYDKTMHQLWSYPHITWKQLSTIKKQFLLHSLHRAVRRFYIFLIHCREQVNCCYESTLICLQ